MLTFELFGELSALAKSESVALEPRSPPVSVRDALELLAEAQPALGPWLDRCAVACGDKLLLRGDAVPGGKSLALLPPVTGG